DGPARAIRAACAIREDVQALGIQIRAGLHTGECELMRDKIGGIAVHTGARVAAAAEPGEVLVSSTVKDLVAGSGIVFADRGEQGWNIGRMVPLVAGWPESVCGTTVDRQCGSSMQTNFSAATAISSGQLDLVVSAGVEMMSRVQMGSNGGDLSDKLLDRWEIVPQGISAEVIADEWGLSR